MVSEDGNTHYFNCLDAKGIYYLVKAYTNLAQGKTISWKKIILIIIINYNIIYIFHY